MLLQKEVSSLLIFQNSSFFHTKHLKIFVLPKLLELIFRKDYNIKISRMILPELSQSYILLFFFLYIEWLQISYFLLSFFFNTFDKSIF